MTDHEQMLAAVVRRAGDRVFDQHAVLGISADESQMIADTAVAAAYPVLLDWVMKHAAQTVDGHIEHYPADIFTEWTTADYARAAQALRVVGLSSDAFSANVLRTFIPKHAAAIRRELAELTERSPFDV
jgi:hypothetical protein